MAKQKRRKRVAAGDDNARAHIPADEKIARLLGLLLVRDIGKKTDQVPLLRRIGFEVSEVASMLDMTENHVMVADHRGRRKKAT